ncbi:pentatricopeptide repeat-containing protein At3g14580, mitochondrial-like [Cornus florida]|uniref:pentatricopeptide repeat-containing protein At3g14580, mitochondrial-like n=1 Tax=Cornus florida TaxID=4283 RepID=UPI0028972ED1|nr:pentatricopeptide repeat-containing protein At3g14580, mitochondrial-like [Cornus florida]
MREMPRILRKASDTVTPLIVKHWMNSSSIVGRSTKIHQPMFRPSLPYPTRIRSVHSSSFSSSRSHLDSDNLNILNHKDWLSPNEVLKIFQTLKDPNSVITVLNQLSKRKDYKPNEALYTTVISKLALAKNFDGIEDVMKRIKTEKSCRLSDDFFYNVIKIYGHVAGRINRAIETLFDMPNYNCWPTVKTFNFVLNLLVNSKQFDIIHEVYMGASRLGVEIDACCLNIIIKGLCGCGDLNAAFYVLDEFPKQGCRPNERTYSTLMHGLCGRGRIEEAFGLFERMEREGIEPDTITFNILISGLRKQGRVEEGIKLLDRMRLKGCNPNPGTYQEVLYGLLGTKKFVEAKEFMGRMISQGVSPSFESYKLMIHGLCKQNLLEDVDWVLKQLVWHGFVPKMGMWRQIVQCAFSKKSSYNSISFEKYVKN